MRRLRHVVVAGLVLALAGCGMEARRTELEGRLQTLVGGTESDLVRRMGAAPTRVVEQGGIRYVSWMFFWPEQPGGAVASTPGMAAIASPGAVVEQATRFCETTFALQQGRVGGYSLRGEACGYGGFPRVSPV